MTELLFLYNSRTQHEHPLTWKMNQESADSIAPIPLDAFAHGEKQIKNYRWNNLYT